MSRIEPLRPGCFYHIYNRGNNRATLFHTPENYRFFLERYACHVEPVAVTYAYCLLPNHFHLLVRIRSDEELTTFGKLSTLPPPHIAFRNLFISYAMAFNRRYARTGSLFARPFRRKHVDGAGYFARLVVYIHRNPQRHGLVDDFRAWPWSSFAAVCSTAVTRIPRAEVQAWFGGLAGFRAAHEQPADELFAAIES